MSGIRWSLKAWRTIGVGILDYFERNTNMKGLQFSRYEDLCKVRCGKYGMGEYYELGFKGYSEGEYVRLLRLSLGALEIEDNKIDDNL